MPAADREQTPILATTDEDIVVRLRRSAERAKDVFAPSFWNPWQEAAYEIVRLREVIRWLHGERGEFPDRPAGGGLYWWRTELRKRAALPDEDCTEEKTKSPSTL